MSQQRHDFRPRYGATFAKCEHCGVERRQELVGAARGGQRFVWSYLVAGSGFWDFNKPACLRHDQPRQDKIRFEIGGAA